MAGATMPPEVINPELAAVPAADSRATAGWAG